MTDRGGERVVGDVPIVGMWGHVLCCEVRGLRKVLLLRRGTGKAVGWTGERYTRENGPPRCCPIEGLIGDCVSLFLSDSYSMLDFPPKANRETYC